MEEKEKRIIEELSFIQNILKYIVVDDSSILAEKECKKQSKLEEEVRRSEVKKGSNNNLEFLEQVLFELRSSIKKDGKKGFSAGIKREKDKEEIKQNYSFIVKYQENENEGRLKVEAEDENKRKYSFEIKREKLVPDKHPYELNIVYENNKAEEKLEVNYNLRDYPSEREKALHDFTNKIDKTLHIMPKSIMGSILGYTYLGENFMARRDDLTGDKALMVDVHEAIHTPDEYETRVLTSWILSRERIKYIK